MNANIVNQASSGSFSAHLLSYNCGVEAFRKNNLSLAIDCLRACIDGDPNNWDARMYLGMALVKAEQPLAAIAHFKAVSDWCPDATQRQRANLVLQSLRK